MRTISENALMRQSRPGAQRKLGRNPHDTATGGVGPFDEPNLSVDRRQHLLARGFAETHSLVAGDRTRGFDDPVRRAVAQPCLAIIQTKPGRAAVPFRHADHDGLAAGLNERLLLRGPGRGRKPQTQARQGNDHSGSRPDHAP